jgi:hypothetical protein
MKHIRRTGKHHADFISLNCRFHNRPGSIYVTNDDTSTKRIRRWHESTQIRVAAMSRRRRFIIFFFLGSVVSAAMNVIFFDTDDIIPDMIILGLVIGLMQAFAPEVFGKPNNKAGHQ